MNGVVKRLLLSVNIGGTNGTIVRTWKKPLWLLLFLQLLWTPCLCDFEVNCTSLLKGQYTCPPTPVEAATQQPTGCTKENKAKINCSLQSGLKCKYGTGLNDTVFEKEIPCQYTNGYSFETALLLSIFLGMFGIDRFYLGYPALGLMKFCTLGFMFFGQLVDIILISLQIVGPADGSNYVIGYFGPKLQFLRTDNSTYVVPQDDW